MADLFEKNVKFIEQRWPHLAELVVSPAAVKASPISFEVVPSRLSGKPTLKLEVSNKKLYIHSAYDPESEAQRWAQGLELKGIRYLGVFGFGLGYHVQELTRAWPALDRIVVVEPSLGTLRAACAAVDLEQVFERGRVELTLVDSRPGEDHASSARRLEQCLGPLFRVGQLDAVQFVEFGPYPRLFLEEYRLLRSVCASLGRQVRINENTILFFSQMWPQNIFANLVYTATSPGVIRLFGRFQNRPGIVVSAGPSLNKNLHLLREAKDRAVLLCVGTALRALLKEGIFPDLVVTLDGAEANYRHFAGLEVDVPLVFVPTAHYRILQEHRGIKFVVGSGNPLIEWVCRFTEPKGQLSMGGSVAHSAFDLALRMRCDPIILVGQDLAYTDGLTHAKGTVYEGQTVQGGKGTFFVEDVFGGQVLTDHVLNGFRLWFERALSSFASGRRVIDATEGGARIAGTAIMTLREALDRYCREQFAVKEVIVSAAAEPVPVAEVASGLLRALEEALASLRHLGRTGRKGAALAKALELEYAKSRAETQAVRKLLSRMERVDKQLRQSEASALLQLVLQPVLLAVTKGALAESHGGAEETDLARRAVARSWLLYEGVSEASKKMEGFLAGAREALMAALQERGGAGYSM